jgi:hypothetical protein
MVVAFHAATLTTRRALPLTQAGLSPARSRQLRLAHNHQPIHPATFLLGLGPNWGARPAVKLVPKLRSVER